MSFAIGVPLHCLGADRNGLPRLGRDNRQPALKNKYYFDMQVSADDMAGWPPIHSIPGRHLRICRQ